MGLSYVSSELFATKERTTDFCKLHEVDFFIIFFTGINNVKKYIFAPEKQWKDLL